MGDKVAYSFDNLDYNGVFNTVGEAMDEALQEIRLREVYGDKEIPSEVYIGVCEFFKPSLSGTSWDMIDAIRCQAEDEGFGGWAEDYLDVSKELMEELETEIEIVFQKWSNKYNLHPTFFKVNAYDIYNYDKQKKELCKVGEGKARNNPAKSN